jgi:hypothetical protein
MAVLHLALCGPAPALHHCPLHVPLQLPVHVVILHVKTDHAALHGHIVNVPTCTGLAVTSPDTSSTVTGRGTCAGTSTVPLPLALAAAFAPAVCLVFASAPLLLPACAEPQVVVCLWLRRMLSATAVENMPRSSGMYCLPARVP